MISILYTIFCSIYSLLNHEIMEMYDVNSRIKLLVKYLMQVHKLKISNSFQVCHFYLDVLMRRLFKFSMI